MPTPMRIIIEQDDNSGCFFATSPAISGLLVAKMSLVDCCNDIPRAVRELSEAVAVPPANAP